MATPRSVEYFKNLITSKDLAIEIIEYMDDPTNKSLFLVILEDTNDDLSNENGEILKIRLAGWLYKNQAL